MARPKPRIYLHMGAHKTGSTSLQINFAQHRAKMAEHGVVFIGPPQPFPHLYSAFLNKPMVYEWNRQSGQSLEQIKARDAEMMERLAGRLRLLRRPAAILSNEYLCKMTMGEMQRLHGFLSEFGEVHAVYFYRELHSWVSSDSQQLARAGMRGTPTAVGVGLNRIYDTPRRIKEAFGGNVTFIKFEEAAKRGVCSSFLEHIGAPGFDAMGLTEAIENEGISGPAVQSLFIYNKRYPLGHPRRDEAHVERLMAKPGPKYTAPGLTLAETLRYIRVRRQAQEELGLTLAPPAQVPVRAGLEGLLARAVSRLWPGR